MKQPAAADEVLYRKRFIAERVAATVDAYAKDVRQADPMWRSALIAQTVQHATELADQLGL